MVPDPTRQQYRRRATRGRRSARERRTERTARAAEEADGDSKTEDDDPDHSPTPNENTESVVETLTTDGGVETAEAATATAPVETPILMLDGNSSTEMTGGRAEVNRPLTRAAKRRLEAEAAARATRQAAGDERRASSAPDGDESNTLSSATRPAVDDANSASTRVADADMTRPAVNDADTAGPGTDDVDVTNESSSTHVQVADTATGGRSAVTASGTIATTDGTVERATAASGMRDDGTKPPLRATDTTTTVTTSGTAPSRRRVTWAKPERVVTSTDSDVESETNGLSGVTSTGEAKSQRRTKAATDVPVAKRPPAKRRSTSGKSTTAVSTPTTDVADDAPETEDEETALPEGTLQLSDDEIAAAQKASRLVQKMAVAGNYHGLKVEQINGLVVVNTKNGRRAVLLPALWAIVLKEMHGSVWAGHLRGPHTYGRVAQLYWWPGLQREVNHWVRGCQECGSRKARPREMTPPLRTLEYVTRYAVAKCVTRHTADNVATFLMEDVVLKFGVFREILTDGAPELAGKTIEQLVLMLQSKQINPVPYRPQMIGLVERFHRSWKDCVAMYMANEQQNDRNLWVKFAVYAYNSARHSTVALSPKELMMGRRLRPPNELLRRMETTEAGELMAYHEKLLVAMTKSHECAAKAMEKEQRRQTRYYNRKTKQKREFRPGDRVWVYNPPRGPKATKFVHKWMGPMRVVESAGYENFLLQPITFRHYCYNRRQPTSRRNSTMKIRAGNRQMNRRTERLYEQRRQVALREKMDDARNDVEAQWRTRAETRRRTLDWWKDDVDGDVTRLDNMSSSMNYCQSVTSDTVTQSVTGNTATQSANDSGFRLVTMNDCAKAGESWKTPMLGKPCNRLVTSSDGGSLDWRQHGGQPVGGSLDWRQRGEQPLEGEEERSAAASSHSNVGRLKYNSGPNEVSGAGEWDGHRHGEHETDDGSGKYVECLLSTHGTEDGSGKYVGCLLSTHGTEDGSGKYVECLLSTHGTDDESGEYVEYSLATHIGRTGGRPGDLDERAHGASKGVRGGERQ
ncbi:hypothetical protein PR003_g16478 [Phytophthora rubi]|uniref:Integrase catalytic domain-containing protein n=1 Tax=Phytophthora rubi TaxID=129364 RepID=A0A6A4EYQ9_9STRA|nr:hypothetical protein PR003_g16478 [Phytophthora rubi]